MAFDTGACVEQENNETFTLGVKIRMVPLLKVRDCKIAAENQSDAVVPNCRFLNPTMAGHSPVLTLQFLNMLFS